MGEYRYKFLIDTLNIDFKIINDDLTMYYQLVENRYMQSAKIVESWGSIENYINTLYYMKFVLKLNLLVIS